MPIYMIQAGTSGYVKIGYTRDPLKRLASLQHASAEDLRLIRLLDGGSKAERLLHKRFNADRVSPIREWFRFNSEMLVDVGCPDVAFPVTSRERRPRIARIPQPKPIAVHVRLKPDTYAWLVKYAARTDRSVAGAALMLLQKYDAEHPDD